MGKNQSKSTKLIAVLACSAALGVAGIMSISHDVKHSIVLADEKTSLQNAQEKLSEAKEAQKNIVQKNTEITQIENAITSTTQIRNENNSVASRIKSESDILRQKKVNLASKLSENEKKKNKEFKDTKTAYSKKIEELMPHTQAVIEKEKELVTLNKQLSQKKLELEFLNKMLQANPVQLAQSELDFEQAKATDNQVQADLNQTEKDKQASTIRVELARINFEIARATQIRNENNSEASQIKLESDTLRQRKLDLSSGLSASEKNKNKEFKDIKTAYSKKIEELMPHTQTVIEKEKELVTLNKQKSYQSEKLNNILLEISESHKNDKSNHNNSDKKTSTNNDIYYPTPTSIKPTVAATKAIKFFEGVGVLEWKFEDGKMKPSTEYLHNNDKTDLTDDIKVDDGVKYVRLANDKNQWIQEQYLHEASEAKEERVSGVLTAGNVPYGIFLRDSEGKMTEQMIQPGTSWRVFGKKTFYGHTYYRLGTDQQWLEDTYVKLYN